MDEGKFLLTDNTIVVDSVVTKEAGVYSQLAQKPNPTIPLIGIPLGLHIYNLADPRPDSTYQRWLHKNPKREERLMRLLSKKQVNALDSIYVGFNNWLQNSGDAPVVIAPNKTEKSVERLKRWYDSYGYFNNEVDYEVDTERKKEKARRNYISRPAAPTLFYRFHFTENSFARGGFAF